MSKVTSEITKKIMLVRLKIHQLPTSKTDKSVTREVCSDKGVADKMGKWNKRLFSTGYEPIKECCRKIYAYHKSVTTPFDDDGYAMLRASLCDEYIETMKQYTDALAELVSAFVAELDMHIDADRTALGETFNITDYPSAADIREKVTVEYAFQSMPTVGGEGINAFTLKELEKLNEERLQKVLKDAAEKPLLDLAGLIKKWADTLSNPTAVFHDTLVGNVREYMQTIDAVNVTDSEAVKKAAAEINALLATIDDTNALRKDKKFRSETANKALAAFDRIQKTVGRSLVLDAKPKKDANE